MHEWNIQLRCDACRQCSQPFAAGTPYHTVLRVVPAGYVREDLCPPCWNAAGGAGIRERAGVVSYWQGVFEPVTPPPADPLPHADAESILRRMIERNDPAEAEARYILAVLLERKRILRHRETQTTDSALLVYENIKTGEVFLIPDPKIRLDRIEDVQRRVATMLQTGEGREAATPAPAAAG